MQIKKENIRNILIIKFRALGDILLSVPAMRAVKDSYPGAKLTVLVFAGGEEVLSGHKFIDEIMIFDKKSGHAIERDLDLILRVMDSRFDMVIDMYGNVRSGVLALLSGAKVRLGLSNRIRNIFLNVIVPGPKEIIYNAEVWLKVVSAIGASTTDKKPSIELPSDKAVSIDAFLALTGLSGAKFAVLNPFASHKTREWPPERFIELSKRLNSSNIPTVIAWGHGQEAAAIEMARQAGAKTRVAPSTGIKELGWLLKKSAIVVTGTTFTQHLAVAVGANVVALFGATDKRAWVDPSYKKQAVLQASLDCMPCEKTNCDDLKCMASITVESVYNSTVKHFA